MADIKKTEDTPQAVSRRKFIQGVIAGGAGVSSATYLFRASGLATAAGASERLITLNVNGQQRRVDVMKQETLAMTLRYKLGLTGTKIGCDRAECGASSRSERAAVALGRHRFRRRTLRTFRRRAVLAGDDPSI